MNCSQRAKPSPNRAQPALVTKAWSTGLTGQLISLLSVRSSNCRSQICQRGGLADITCSPLNTALGAKCNHSVLLHISDHNVPEPSSMKGVRKMFPVSLALSEASKIPILGNHCPTAFGWFPRKEPERSVFLVSIFKQVGHVYKIIKYISCGFSLSIFS